MWQGVARRCDKEVWQGGVAKRCGKELRQGGMTRCGKEVWQRVAARRHDLTLDTAELMFSDAFKMDSLNDS